VRVACRISVDLPMRAGTLGAASAVTLALLTPVSASATESIALAGSQPGQRTIELNREQSGKLAGELWLVVTRKGPPAKLKLQFSSISPIGKSEAPWVKFARGVEPTVSGTKPTRVQLSFSLPADASPEDLEGLVRLLPVVHGHPSRDPVEVSVAGVGDALAGVSLEPASVALQVEKSAPWNEPGKVGASVQLSGPGVPRLLARPRYPGFDLLLQSDHGHELQARLTKLTKVSATVASARISVKGPFHIGTYEGAGPISDLSPKSPSLTIKLTSGDSFIWPLILAFAGSLVGGALYLASGVRRRRMLLRKETKAILGRYLDTVQKRKDSAPLWPLDEYLGDKSDWYKVMWNAAAQLDGAVRALWSSIHWARTDADLDAAAKELLELRTRIIRWLTAAKSVDALATVSKMELPAVMEAAWDTTHTVGDTRDLLTIVKEVAPPTDEATASLIDRLTRQAHWHERFAGAWYAKSVLIEAMDSQTYLHKDHLKVQNIDLEALDAKASPESGRKPEMQVQLERDLTTAMRQIRGLYHGQASDLTLPDGGPVAGATVAFTTDAVFGAVDRSAMARVPPSDPAGTADERNPNTEWLTILARDLPWTLAVTAVSSAAYVPTIFSRTWGRPSDYVSAFAAGFVGKVVVNWGALPLFQSLRGSAGGQTQTGGSSAAAA
jgi:hypothetical protein